jgi:hypothetical protein
MVRNRMPHVVCGGHVVQKMSWKHNFLIRIDIMGLFLKNKEI